MLTEIDVQATLRDKLGQDMEDYLILGACNPPLAHRALDADRKIGLLLPCNVVVRTAGGQTIIEALNPQVMVEVAGQASLKPVADEATSRIMAALDSVKDVAGQHAEHEFTEPRSIPLSAAPFSPASRPGALVRRIPIDPLGGAIGHDLTRSIQQAWQAWHPWSTCGMAILPGSLIVG